MKNIIDVVPDRDHNTVTITHQDPLSLDEINGVLCEYGYRVHAMDQMVVQPSDMGVSVVRTGDLQETLSIAGILLILYYFANQFDLLSYITVST